MRSIASPEPSVNDRPTGSREIAKTTAARAARRAGPPRRPRQRPRPRRQRDADQRLGDAGPVGGLTGRRPDPQHAGQVQRGEHRQGDRLEAHQGGERGRGRAGRRRSAGRRGVRWRSRPRLGRVAGPGGRPSDRASDRPSDRASDRASARAAADAGHAGGHQFRRPSRITVAGTSRVRTRNVSIRIPAARPRPIARTWLASAPELATVSTMNVPPRISPAEVTVEPGPPDRLDHRVAQRKPPRLLADPGHDQDVVVLAEREQEHEHQERQDEADPAVAPDVDERRSWRRPARRGRRARR